MPGATPEAPPELMSVACARFFASDWELSSLLEFVADLRLRAAEELRRSFEIATRRLGNHLVLTLQIAVVRSTENYFAYLRDVRQAIDLARAGTLQRYSIMVDSDEVFGVRRSSDLVAILDTEAFSDAVRFSSAVKLASAFAAATELDLFESAADADILARLLAVRNVVSHNRTLVSEAFSELLDDPLSSDLGVDWKQVRLDLVFLRRSVRRIDEQAAAKWKIERPITRSSYSAAVEAAASGKRLRENHDLALSELFDDATARAGTR